MRVLIILGFVLISSSLNIVISKEEDSHTERKDAFVNDPVELKQVYHTPNAYEERSYDFWYENWPHPHVHGDKPNFDERHQHFPGYGDNYDFSNFITDPPSQLGAKSETVLEESSLVDEPTASDKVIKKSDEIPEEPSTESSVKSVDQPKKDYENPSESSSISGEKLSKPISSLPAEGKENEGDPYSALSSISSSSSSKSSSGSGSSGAYPEGPSHKSGYPQSGSASGSESDSASNFASSSSVNTETSGNPSNSRDVYSSSSSAQGTSAQGTSANANGGGYLERPPSSAASPTGSKASIPPREDEYFKSPPGTQPEVFPISKPNTGDSQNSKPTPRVDEFFPEETEQPHQTLSPVPASSGESSGIEGAGEEKNSGRRSCCPCCRDPNLTPAIPAGAGGGCGAPTCGPPPIVGTPPRCCPQAPVPCCPRLSLPSCCLPQYPCCPRIQLTCCPPIQICCQPLNFGCGGGCKSRAVTRLRTKRNGCIPCIGRKKREIEEEEEAHIRQKRLGCIPCLAREKRQATQQQNCQKCNLFQEHIVRRVKRTFSCSSCASHRERVKRQTQIADFYKGNQLGAYRNCQQCYDLPLPTRAMKKRESGFSEGQHNFMARIRRASDGYDPLFQCDSGCCDYEKCIKSKPLRGETFKVPEDSDFISGTSSKDYDLPDLKEEEKTSSSSDSKREELIGTKDSLNLGGSDKNDNNSFRS